MTLAIQERESDYHKYHDKNYQNYHYITAELPYHYIPPIPLQALVAALKLITSSVWFFSHALIATRKREDVQSYTEASHSTRRCHANSYFPPSSQH